MKNEILYVENLTTNLSATCNIDHISFSLNPGEILGITGLQQSGINVLADALSGNVRASSGTIYLAGKPVVLTSRSRANDLGIYEIKHSLSVIPTLSVSENLNVLRNFSWKHFFIDKKQNLELTRMIFSHYHISADPDAYTKQLSKGQQLELSICRALLCGARILVCWEIGEGLSLEEFSEVQQFLFQLRSEGIPIIMLNSDPRIIMQLADRMIVLRNGMICYRRAAAEASLEEISRCIDPEVPAIHPQVEPISPKPVLLLSNLHCPGIDSRTFSAELFAGAIHGLFWKSSTQGDLVLRMFSGRVAVKGTVTEAGKTCSFRRWRYRNRKDILCLGIRFWEANLHENLTLAENLCLRTFSRFDGRAGILNNRMLWTALLDFCQEYGIDPDLLTQYPRHLSPDIRNQIVLWSVLFAPPKYLVLDCLMYTMDEQIRRNFLNCLSVLHHTDTAILWSCNNGPLLQNHCDHITTISEND